MEKMESRYFKFCDQMCPIHMYTSRVAIIQPLEVTRTYVE